MAGRMAGKTALSSGAASGLGEAQAKVFTQVRCSGQHDLPGTRPYTYSGIYHS